MGFDGLIRDALDGSAWALDQRPNDGGMKGAGRAILVDTLLGQWAVKSEAVGDPGEQLSLSGGILQDGGVRL
jgi:hypothetical protein